jgi:hypothetical protein
VVGDPSRFSSADALAAVVGLVPATRQSRGASFRWREGNRTLKDLLCRSDFCSTAYHAPSKAFYDRKRVEGKAPSQAVIALARRRVGVLWAMLRDGQLYGGRPPAAAWLNHRDATPSPGHCRLRRPGLYFGVHGSRPNGHPMLGSAILVSE